MVEMIYWAELRRLSLNAAAAHIAVVAFLEEAPVPWTDDQTLEFEGLVLAERIALRAYSAFVDDPRQRPAVGPGLRLAAGE